MSNQKTEPENLPLEAFPFQTFDKVRYADTDRQRHVNNATFATFLETGQVEVLNNPQSPLAGGDWHEGRVSYQAPVNLEKTA